MSDTSRPQEAAEIGLSSRSLFGLRVFDRDILHHAQIMADQVTKPSGMTFAEIAEKAWQSRPKHGKICGAETFRLRAFEHLQNAVHYGKIRKEGKIYLPHVESVHLECSNCGRSTRETPHYWICNNCGQRHSRHRHPS